LLVPFDLGRPLGRPDAPELQALTLRTALQLLDKPGPGPLVDVLEVEVEPYSCEETWVCPISFSAPEKTDLCDRLKAEMRLLRPLWERGCKDRGHTTVGVSGIELDLLPDWLCTFLDSPMSEVSPLDEQSLVDSFKLAVEDLKAFHLEATITNPGGTANELNNWFWDETAAGELLLKLRESCADHPDSGVRLHASFTLVPETQVHRKGVSQP
jgi:hypothetical protein